MGGIHRQKVQTKHATIQTNIKMALSKKSVDIATKILRTVNPKLGRGIIKYKGEEDTQRVLGRDKKSDGGWESVFAYLKNPTSEQLDTFNRLKGGIGNTSFVREENGFTKIGWF